MASRVASNGWRTEIGLHLWLKKEMVYMKQGMFGIKVKNMNQLYNEDCLTALKKLSDNSIDCMVTDPPYGYSFMGKDWDKVVPSVDIWKECLRVLKPGAFAFVMSAPRQDVLSQMIVRLTDAGFNMGYSSIYWTYSSGFPKAHNIGKTVDKQNGVEREVIGNKSGGAYSGENNKGIGEYDKLGGKERKKRGNDFGLETKGHSPLEGSYGGLQPKPAVEIIIVAMKPLTEKTFVAQALKNGKGITWLDDCRIPYNTDDKPPEFCKRPDMSKSKPGDKSMYDSVYGNKDNYIIMKQNQVGRFPANLLVSDDVLNDGTITKSNNKAHDRKSKGMFAGGTSNVEGSDKGSYSRYFDLDKWFNTTYPFLITPKASKREKNAGCDDLNTVLHNGHQFNKQTGEPWVYSTKNNHPTVKPIKLMSYLIVLGSRENDIVLDPFAGSGTTLVASKMLNRQYIGCEMSKEYVEIIEARLSSVSSDKPIESNTFFS